MKQKIVVEMMIDMDEWKAYENYWISVDDQNKEGCAISPFVHDIMESLPPCFKDGSVSVRAMSKSHICACVGRNEKMDSGSKIYIINASSVRERIK